jgi:hypothetical protein
LLDTSATASIYTSVRGVRHYGLIIDPGASKGLIGQETLNEIIQYVLKPAGLDKHVQWTTSRAKFTGISKTVEMSLGVVTFPIGLVGLKNSTFSADVIPGHCPGLVPLVTMIKIKAIIACGYYDNADGLCVINTAVGSRSFSAPQRLRWTDSGHYMLPINNYNVSVNRNLNQSAQKLRDFMDKSAPEGNRSPSANLFSNFPVHGQTDYDFEDFAEETQSFQ